MFLFSTKTFFKALPSTRHITSTSIRMAARDTNPNTKTAEGPSRAQDATNPQKDFAERLPGVDLSAGATKGEASDKITEALNRGAGNQTGSGAAPDNTPGSKIPSGPSAQQDATRSQKDFVNRLGASDQLPEGASKGQASDVISSNLNSGNTGGSGAAPDTTPGNVKPTGPSAEQPATRAQKDFIERLGEQVPAEATKGEASNIISSRTGN